MPFSRRHVLLAAAAAMPSAAPCVPVRAPSFVDRKAVIRAAFAAAPPRLQARHLALMRQLGVIWVPIESGAPGVDPWTPLAGAKDTVRAAMAGMATGDETLAIRTLAELGLLVPAFVREAALAPGRYAVPPATLAVLRRAEAGVDAEGGFALRDEHLRLLRAARWRVIDADSLDDVLAGDAQAWPMPYIDGKRPYGDRSHYQSDMAALLGQPGRLDAEGGPSPDPDRDARLAALHRETLAALQVVLACAAA